MDDCIFCKIINKEIPSTILYEDDEIIAFEDVNPLHPVHTLVVPKKHIPTTCDLTEDDTELVGKIFLVAKKIAEEKGIDEEGYRIVNNCKEFGGQAVYHIHFHLLGGEKLPVK